jgi:hypothetical protein
MWDWLRQKHHEQTDWWFDRPWMYVLIIGLSLLVFWLTWRTDRSK